MPQMQNSAVDLSEEDIQTALTAALSLIEPIILVVMGVIVVTITIALYLPIFSLGRRARWAADDDDKQSHPSNDGRSIPRG